MSFECWTFSHFIWFHRIAASLGHCSLHPTVTTVCVIPSSQLISCLLSFFTSSQLFAAHVISEKLSYREAFTHRSLYTQTLLHTDAFTQALLHTEAFTHGQLLHTASFYTEQALTQRSFHTEKLLHTEAFTQKLALCKSSSVLRLLCVKACCV